MRALLLFSLLTILYLAAAAPAKSKLQTGTNDADGQPFVEEVVVESVLHVRSPSSRQARTNTQTSLQDGARVAEAKIYH
ncbi:hypothetical protein B5X24_HaOG204390 [Helicoverpa armigera]|uniref:Uncharacterized protein n=2 Tax=Heliothinae TaxID=95178 RepID=A0A2A4JEY8_HELVI|nr:hypothetical protein B5X24_HaOG204390 [Helicoverpa armigera]